MKIESHKLHTNVSQRFFRFPDYPSVRTAQRGTGIPLSFPFLISSSPHAPWILLLQIPMEFCEQVHAQKTAVQVLCPVYPVKMSRYV